MHRVRRVIPERNVVSELARAKATQALAVPIAKIVEASFKSHPMQFGATSAEKKRRTEICTKWLFALVNEKRWDMERAVDHLQVALVTELDGKQWTPPDTTLWAPPSVLLSR